MTLISIDREDAQDTSRKILQKIDRLIVATRDGDVANTLMNATDLDLLVRDLRLQLEAALAPTPTTDAAILDWLQQHYVAIDFDYPQAEGGALIIELPDGARVGADLRKSVANLIEAGQS